MGPRAVLKKVSMKSSVSVGASMGTEVLWGAMISAATKGVGSSGIWGAKSEGCSSMSGVGVGVVGVVVPDGSG
jgi:hypothetical protein